MLALISSGFASPTNTVIGTSNTAINSGATNYQADEDAYLRDVVKPANDANRLTPEMAAILERHLGRLENNNVPPRRDRGSEPDDAGYSFRDNDENLVPDLDWRDISEDGQQLQPGDDWNSGPLAFEFVFEWYGEEYNSVNVNSNGWLSLNPDDRQTAINLPECPNAGAPNPAFCVLNYDLDPRNGGALYFWTNEEDEAIVSFVDYPNYGNNDLTTTCQVIFSGDGSVLYQYAEFNGHDGQNANVGYESPDGQMGASISFREGGGYLEDGRVIRIANQWIIDEDNPHIVVDPEDLEFGQQIVDRESTMEVEATNLGGVDLTVSAITTEGDGFSTAGLEEDLVVASGESFMIEVTFAAGAEQEYEGALVIESDAVNAEEGLTTVPLFGEGVSPLDLSIDPQAIESELNTGEMSNHVITVSNAGGEDWPFTTALEFIDAEEEENVRNGRGGPHRDDPPDGAFAIFQDQRAWGFYGDWFEQRIEDIDVQDFRQAGDLVDVDLADFDCIWVATGEQSANFTNTWNENVDRFNEWVSDGGVIFVEQGWNGNHVAEGIGGLRDDRVPQEGMLAPGLGDGGDEENWLVDQMGWGENQRFPGGSTFHCIYPEERFDDIDDSDFYQVIAIGDRTQDPGIVWYEYGRGNVIVSGSPIGHQWVNHNIDGRWGQCGPTLCYWMADILANRGIPWLSVDPMASPDGGVPPGEDSEVTLTWDATDLEEGEYDGLLIIESNDPGTPFLIIGVILIVGEVEPVHFTEFDRDGDTHTITVTEAMFDGDDIGRGWEIGLFDPDGNLGGAGVWNGQALPIMAYGGEEADQFDGNEAFSFVYWDPNDGDEGMEWGATPTWGEGPEVFNAGSESTVSLNGGRTRELTIELGDGWDMISVNVMLNPGEYDYEGDEPGPDVKDMFRAWAGEGRDHNVELLKDAEGRFWRPSFDFTNIPFWDYAQGYQIKLHEGDAITWEGEEMDAQSDVPMSTGWQMIGYFPTYDLDASGPDFYVLSDIIDRVFLAKNGAGQFMRPAFRFSNMPPWSEGYGYQVKLDPPEEGDGDLIFNYPEEMQEGAYVGEAGANGSHWTSPTASDANMSVLITEFSGIELGEGDQVAAFSTSGMQIGLGTITEGRSGIAVWADEENTEAIEGALHGEAFTLKLWDADKAVEHNLEVNTINWGKGLVYETNSFVALEVTVQSIIPDVYSLSQNFPNPFNSITKLSFGLPEDSEVSISVFDVSGRLVTTLVNGQLTAGNHVVAWNAQGNATGLYLVKMETLGGFSAVRKVVLTK